MIVTISDSYGIRTEKIDASTAAVLIGVTRDLFGPGIVRDPDGVVISLETGDLVSGLYTWNPRALGEASLSSCMHDGHKSQSHRSKTDLITKTSFPSDVNDLSRGNYQHLCHRCHLCRGGWWWWQCAIRWESYFHQAHHIKSIEHPGPRAPCPSMELHVHLTCIPTWSHVSLTFAATESHWSLVLHLAPMQSHAW